MCASVCPSEALWYGTRRSSTPPAPARCSDDWLFGRQRVHTKVFTVVDEGGLARAAAGLSVALWLIVVALRRLMPHE
jgi:hypothetical protein